MVLESQAVGISTAFLMVALDVSTLHVLPFLKVIDRGKERSTFKCSRHTANLNFLEKVYVL